MELVGGIMLTLGLFTPVAGLLIALMMFGAFWFAHRTNGLFVKDGGWELVGVIAAGALALAAAGAGRYSLDHVLTRRRPTQARSRT